MRRFAPSSVRRTTSVMGYSFLLVSRSFSSVFHRPRALSSSAVSSSSPIVFSFRSYLVQFQPTPNDSCMKFFVENVAFLTTPPPLDPSPAVSSSSVPLPLQPGEIDLDSQSNRSNMASSSSTPPTTPVTVAAATFTFDQSNQHQSPLANAILSALPMVSEVVIGPTFVTVRRMEAEEFEERVREAKAEVAPPPGAQGGQAPAATSAVNPFAASVNPLGGGVSAPLPPPPATSTTQSPEQPQKAERTNQHHSEDDEELSHYQRQKRQEVGMSGDANVSSSEEGGGDPLHELDEDTLRKLFNMLDWSELKYVVSALITDHLYSGDPHIALDAPHPHMDTMPQEGDSEIVLSIKELITTSIRPVLQADGGDIRFLSYRDEAAAAVVVGDEGIKKAEQKTLSTSAEETDVLRQTTLGECGKVASLSAPTPSLVADQEGDASRQEVHGVVVIELLGSCKSCKSAKTTLTDLIERTMRHWIPEVKKIEAMLRIGTRSELVPLEVAIKQQQ